MSFSRKSKVFDGLGHGGHGDDLMVTPLLDLFVALIPFLVMGAVMTKINIIDVGVSKPVSGITNPQKNNFDLQLKVNARDLNLSLGKKLIWSGALGANSEKSLESLHQKLVELKKTNLGEQKIKIEPSSEVELEELMRIMDVVRNLKPSDGELKRTENNLTYKLKYLFPQIILKGVYDS